MTDISNKDLLALRSYISNPNPSSQNRSSATILLDITHSNLHQKHIEIRFNKHETLDDLRQRIHRQTGTPVDFQLLKIKNSYQNQIWELNPGEDGTKKLGYYGLEDGYEVHCIDLNPHSGSKGGWYEDTTLVEKYRMKDDDYNARSGTLRDWARKQKEQDQGFTFKKHEKAQRELNEARRRVKMGGSVPLGYELNEDGIVVSRKKTEENDVPLEDSVVGIELGMRCEVSPGGRRGEVKFVGVIESIGVGGYWVGVQFDEPVGKSDGSVKGVTYFEAQKGFGGFVRGLNISVGDFPERDIFDNDELCTTSDSEDEL